MTTTTNEKVIPEGGDAAPSKAAATTTNRDYPSQEASTVGSSLSRAIVEPQKQQWTVSPQIEIVKQESGLWLVRTTRYPSVVAAIEPRFAASLLAAGRIQTRDITRQTSPTADLEAAMCYIQQVEVCMEMKKVFPEERPAVTPLKQTVHTLTTVTMDLRRKMIELSPTEYHQHTPKKK